MKSWISATWCQQSLMIGSLVLQYNPYEAHWEAKVDWSDDSEVKVTGPNGEVVLYELCDKMREVVQKL